MWKYDYLFIKKIAIIIATKNVKTYTGYSVDTMYAFGVLYRCQKQLITKGQAKEEAEGNEREVKE